MLRIKLTCLTILTIGLIHFSDAGESKPTLTIFAAASLLEPLEEIGKTYSKEHHAEIRFSFAASSTLARQIEAGALPNVFISANSTWMDYLAKRALINSSSRTSLLTNTLVIAAPATSSVKEFELTKATNLTSLLAPGERIAMGDPEHVPAGIYSMMALRKLGMWAQLAPLVARADNTRAALALIERGEAPFGFIYATDAAISQRVKVIARIPVQAHPEIRYDAATLDNLDQAASAFLSALLEPQALEIFSRYGFKSYELR